MSGRRARAAAWCDQRRTVVIPVYCAISGAVGTVTGAAVSLAAHSLPVKIIVWAGVTAVVAVAAGFVYPARIGRIDP